MHILFLSHYFPPEVNAPATRTFEHCRAWVRAGHRVTVVTCAPNCPAGVVFDGYRNAWRTEEAVDGIRVIRVWTLLSANKGFLRRILNFVSYLVTATWQALWLRGVDVVVATSPQFFCGWAGVLCRWLRRRPFVLEIRDIWPESIVTVGAMRRSPAIRFLEWLERRMYAAADHIVTVGDGYRDQLLAKGVAAKKITVIPNGVDLDAWRPRGPRAFPLRVAGVEAWRAPSHSDGDPPRAGLGAALRSDPCHPSRAFCCAYVGTVGMAHGLEVVLSAAEKLKSRGRADVAFWIVGDGAERAALEADARRRGLDNVVFTGLVPREVVADVLAACDASLVHLRGTELFGTVIPSKIFETMAMNVPIVMGVRGQAQRIVLEAEAGVAMTPDDADSLLEAIDELRANPGRCRNGRDYVARHYDRNRLAARMLDTLSAIAAVRHGRPGVEDPSNADRRAA